VPSKKRYLFPVLPRKITPVVGAAGRCALISPQVKPPVLESRATIVERVFALVAFDVTVKVAFVDWFAVKV
jgi:hypothetical protein